MSLMPCLQSKAPVCLYCCTMTLRGLSFKCHIKLDVLQHVHPQASLAEYDVGSNCLTPHLVQQHNLLCSKCLHNLCKQCFQVGPASVNVQLPQQNSAVQHSNVSAHLQRLHFSPHLHTLPMLQAQFMTPIFLPRTS